MDTGNPWVNLDLPVPVPVETRTRPSWVRVSTGFPKGTGTGTGILRMDFEKAKKLCYKILKNTDWKKKLPGIIKKSLAMQDKQAKNLCVYPPLWYGFDGYGYGYAQGYKKSYPYPYPSYPYLHTRRVYPYPCPSLDMRRKNKL